MKRIITSNWRPLRRALCTLLLGVTAFLGNAQNAGAQIIYLSQSGNGANTGSVGEYDATTGTVINASLITGVNQAGAIFLSGNTLYVANNSAFGMVGDFNATTGAPINANLITRLPAPDGFALSGSTLFVSTGATGLGVGKVGTYNASTGAATNANFITTGAIGPTSMLLLGNTLLVANTSANNHVVEYNATTRAEINANFILGSESKGLALSRNTLFVLNGGPVDPNSYVGEYNATTGATINANFITGSVNPIYANGLAFASVPEPSTWSMIAARGVALLGAILRKKHRPA